MAPARSATAAMLLGAAAGCGVGAEQPPALGQLTPVAGYNDVALAADIYGQGFRPTYRFDAVSGDSTLDVSGWSATLVAAPAPAARGSYDLAQVVWESDTILGAQIPAGLPVGRYDLVVRDPRGHTARQPMAFTSLGPDTDPPRVALASPAAGGAVAAGAVVPVVVSADDGFGHIAQLVVTASTAGGPIAVPGCPVTGGGTAGCSFQLTAPAPASDGDTLTVDAVATDTAGLTGEARAVLALGPAPVATGMTPTAGTTLGATLVTISGAGFLAGASVSFDAQPAFVKSVTPTALTLSTPAHVSGRAAVTVTSGGVSAVVAGTFLFVAPPSVREIDPTSGPAAGYVPITIVGESFSTTTVITFGSAPLLCPRLVNSNRIQGLVPPGSGTAAVSASDPIGGALAQTNVPFSYIGGALPGPSDASADAAPVLPPDAGCPGGAP